MKRVIRCAEDKLNNSGLYSVDDMSFKDAKNLIKNSLSTAEYIQISYYDPFAHTTSGTAFKRIDGEWAWVIDKSGRIMNEGTVNEKNSRDLSNNYVLNQLLYTLRNKNCQYINIE